MPDLTERRARNFRFTKRGWELRRVSDKVLASSWREWVRMLGEQRMRQFEVLVKKESSVREENGRKIKVLKRVPELPRSRSSRNSSNAIREKSGEPDYHEVNKDTRKLAGSDGWLRAHGPGDTLAGA